jgi:hypothetical protein
MKRSKLGLLILFISPIFQSLAANLLTNEGKKTVVGQFFINYKEEFYILTGIIFIIALYYSIKTVEKDATRRGNKAPKFLPGKAIIATLTNALIGLALGLIILWAYNFLIGSYSAKNQVVHFFTVFGVLKLTAIITGMIAGGSFERVYGDSLVGSLLGGALGWATISYFQPGLQIQIAPSLVLGTSVIMSMLIYATIHLFTGIFTRKYWGHLNEEENDKKDLQKFNYSVAVLNSKNLIVRSNNTFDLFAGFFEMAFARDTGMTVEETKAALKTELQPEEYKLASGFYDWLKSSFGKPTPPFKIFDQNNSELLSFPNIEALYLYCLTLQDPDLPLKAISDM